MRRRFMVPTILSTLVAVALLGLAPAAQTDLDSAILDLMSTANSMLEASGADVRLEVVEYLTAQDEQGNTVLFSDVGNQQLAFDFVPGDPRRILWSGPIGPGDDITWASDTSVPDGNAFPVSSGGLPATQAAIASAMATWQDVNCSSIPLTYVPTGGNIGRLEWLFFGTGAPLPAADVVHAGFGTPLDPFLPSPIIAATFTFVFPAVLPVPLLPGTDIDNDGRVDVALREIYYTRNFTWDTMNSPVTVDVQTLALHEAGHGLSQGHFGQLFRTDRNGRFHFAPRAVMNAGYSGVQRSLAGTDIAGHCGDWDGWPSN